MRRSGPLIGLCVTIALCLHQTHRAAAASGFIRVSNGRFVDEDCREFIVSGLNT